MEIVIKIVLAWFLFGSLSMCTSVADPNSEKKEVDALSATFSAYLFDVFRLQVPEEPRKFVFITNEVCGLCRHEFNKSMEAVQNMVIPGEVIFIIDFSKDSLLEAHRSHALCDSISSFSQYDFPKGYITSYETQSGLVSDYVILKDFETLENYFIQLRGK